MVPDDPKTDSDLRNRLLARIAEQPGDVWTPSDFADLANRDAVDKSLQRLATAGEFRRIARCLYNRPSVNSLTGRPTVPDYRAVIRAVARRNKARFVVDGMTAANDLGLTTTVPARIEVLVDAHMKPIKLGNQEIHFKPAAASRLYWATTSSPSLPSSTGVAAAQIAASSLTADCWSVCDSTAGGITSPEGRSGLG